MQTERYKVSALPLFCLFNLLEGEVKAVESPKATRG